MTTKKYDNNNNNDSDNNNEKSGRGTKSYPSSLVTFFLDCILILKSSCCERGYVMELPCRWGKVGEPWGD